jgi:hypothetical protein
MNPPPDRVRVRHKKRIRRTPRGAGRSPLRMLLQGMSHRTKRRIKLATLTILCVVGTLGMSWCATGRMAGDPSVPKVSDGPAVF